MPPIPPHQPPAKRMQQTTGSRQQAAGSKHVLTTDEMHVRKRISPSRHTLACLQQKHVGRRSERATSRSAASERGEVGGGHSRLKSQVALLRRT
ncbi:hypothetical protein E2C01_037748 [Portunus trituberculatus]|uniref:Uncharacterized protein n=1 Tax=Portunus trituberculatus TaxID=210409 RepID=A0A5B7FEU7_PORTR|nr:hypothetical protein [Portunus trituberculatus]